MAVGAPEAVLDIGEVRGEGGPAHGGSAQDPLDGDVLVAVAGRDVGDGLQEAIVGGWAAQRIGRIAPSAIGLAAVHRLPAGARNAGARARGPAPAARRFARWLPSRSAHLILPCLARL